jgi:hypothetical protein
VAGDHGLFTVLRSLADVVLVAAGTVRAERYGPSATPIAVVSRSLRLDWDARFFTAPVARPILVTVAQAPPDQLARAAEVVDVVIAGDRDVDLATALAALGERGWRAVLAEGGPPSTGSWPGPACSTNSGGHCRPGWPAATPSGSWTAGRSPPPAACDPARSASRTGSCFSAIARDAPSRRADMG